ncbi:hypothetical protein EIF95_20200 [Escherichia coli]|nr:hypothetical protein [Escherichia coli]EFN7758015.1 hypothetical protein [Escherichia coli]
MAWPARLDCDRRKPFSSRLLSWRKNQKITCFILVIKFTFYTSSSIVTSGRQFRRKPYKLPTPRVV